MNTKRIISILTTLCLIASCFTGVISVSAEDAVLESISAETVCAATLSTDSTINVTATQEEGYIGVTITSELLKNHENGEGTPGYWAGFAVVAPEGATHLKYAFGTSDEITLGEAYALTDGDVVTADGKKGIAFYANAGSNDAKTHAKLQWFSDETTAMSAETTFVMNLDGINLDGIEKEDVEIRSLDKKSGYVRFYGHTGDISVDFSKIKMEYGFAEIDLKTEFDVANVADFDSDDAVYDEGSYKVELINEYEICITMKNLVMHTNGNGDEGHWTGFSVKAPEGAKYLTYWKTFGNNSYDYQTITFEEGQTEESFYINVTECDTIEEIELQWFDENHSPLSDYEWYEIDLSNVEIAAENEVTFETANVCDSFPGENAPAKVYEDYSVELNGNIIRIAMTDLVLHRNANKEPGYWTGFTVNVPEGTKYLTYDKNFGHEWYIPHTITLEDGQTSESFYFDVMEGWYTGSRRTITLQFLDENHIPITRRMSYRIDNSNVEIKYPEENTITKANVADFDSDESVYEEYDVACEWDTIELSATNLKAHTNGNGDEGHWIGFSVEAPEGATHYTYDFGNSYEYTPVALEDGETSISFYVNASSPDAKDYLEIRWYCDEDEPESYPYTHAYDYCSYYIDLTNVDLADDVAVDVTAANIVNQNAPESAPYTGTPSLAVEDGTIKLAVEELKTHFNGNGDLGAWVGVSISRPDNAEYVKYVFDEEYNAWWGSADYELADEVADENTISFYVDAYDKTPKNTIMLQWFDENEVAITNILTYELDLSDVDYLLTDEAEISFEKANIVDQDDPDEPAYVGKYDVNLENDTIKLSADCIKVHMNAEDNWGSWIGFKASVEGARYLKYVFENDDWYYDWYSANQIEISDSESFYVDASDYYSKNIVMLQWFDENGNALTNVNTYKIDIEKVTTEDSFPVLFSNIELTGSDARFYNLVPNDEHVEWVSNADYVYVLTFEGANGSVALTVNGTDESNGGNVFYRDENKTVTLTATPNSGYVFNGWYDIRNGNNVSNTVSYEVALDNCYTLEARFSTASSSRPSSGGGGGISIAKPVANIPTGEVEAGTKVELSTKTEDAVIYYTVDGTTPSAESTLYSGAITITEDTTIKAIAIKGKTKSSVLTVKYTVKKVTEGEKPGVTAPVFTDITNYAWANEAIVALAEKGIIKGVSDAEFAPANDIKRADFMLLLVRMLDLKADVTSNFDDVSSDKYYYEGVGIAKALGLTTGVGDNKFNPEASITRQDMFVLAYRILQMQNAGLIDADESAINTFDDYSKIADYAKEGLSSLVKNDLVKGSDNKINPVGNATRAETAVFIYRLYNLLNK